MNTRFVILNLIFWVMPSAALAQRVLLVSSNDTEANLFVDDEWIGRANGEPVRFPKDAAELVVTSGRGDTWSIAPLSFDVSALEGDTLRISADFPYHYKIESVPFNVEVFEQDGDRQIHLGRTPLTVVRPEPIEGTLVLEREGYSGVRIEPGRQIWNRSFVQLETDTAGNKVESGIEFSLPDGRRRWVDVAIAGAAVSGGILAIRYRTRADRLYDEYLETGNLALRSEIKRLDAYSIASLGVMQVGVGVFVYRVAF